VDRAKNLPGLAPNIWLTLFQISSKSVHLWWSYSRPRKGHSLGPLGKSTIRPKLRWATRSNNQITLKMSIHAQTPEGQSLLGATITEVTWL